MTMTRQQAVQRFNELQRPNWDEYPEACDFFSGVAIADPDTSDEKILEYARTYHPEIVDPLKLWNDTKEAIKLLDIIYRQDDIR